MPTTLFDFDQDPFSSDPELKFFYKSSNLDLIYKKISTNFNTGDSVIVITGIEGSGKTFLLHKLRQEFSQTIKFFMPEASEKSFQGIVTGICQYLEIDNQDNDFFENIIALDNFLNNSQVNSLRVALIVDDADQLEDAVLKKLLMLAVEPSEQRGALEIILTGLPALQERIEKLELPDEAQLKKSGYELQTFTAVQVKEYINKRLFAVGSQREDLFSPDAIVNIALYSKGNPESINRLCKSALSLVASQKLKTVTKDTVDEVIRTNPGLFSDVLISDDSVLEEQKIEDKSTIEKLHLRVSNTAESPLLKEDEPKKGEQQKPAYYGEYVWALAALLLLLIGIYFYGSGVSLLGENNTSETIADLAELDTDHNKKRNLKQAKTETLEKSDQALLDFDEAASPETSLESLKPMLMANKKSLYQKVLTKPDAILFQQPKISKQSAITLPAFSVYYVYLRIKDENSQEWLQVGLGRKGDLAGWLKASDVEDWNQGLTVAFRESKGQDRVMLFNDRQTLKKIVEKYDFENYQRLYKAASKDKVLEDSPVVAIQPATDIDIHKNFYLLPIHDYEETYLKGETARLLQVSSISRPTDSGSNNHKQHHSEKGLQGNRKATSYKAGMAFVIDSTFSMQPYIKRTRKAVEKIYERLGQSNLLGQVNFGLMAFRDNTQVVPEIKYVTRQYVSLKQGENPRVFLSAVNSLSAAKISSQDFIEDSYAGVANALNNMAWKPHAARYIVLITDAGAREANDPLSSSGFNAALLNQMAQDKGVAIFVMHILSTDSQADNAAAAKQYRELSDYPGIGSLYYAVPTANVQEFGKVIETLAQQITDQVAKMNGEESKPIIAGHQNEKLAALQKKVAKLGHALELNYLQNTKNGKVPEIFKSWVLDKDFNHPEKSALDVSVLLTRDQLSDLHSILKQVLETARQGKVSPQQFIDELKSLAATLVRDPKQLGETTATTSSHGQSLAEMGFMREYIEDLPYKGELMSLSLDDWESWSAEKQEVFLNNLQDKINYYRMIHDNLDVWVSLEGKSIDGDAVFPVPLNMLP